jgi:phosphoglycerate kinase
MKFIELLKKEDLFGKTCLLRVDLNIAEKEAKNSPRVKGILPTIEFLIKNGAKVVILSHRGRPKGFDKKQSLKPFAKILSSLLKKQVYFIDFNKSWAQILASINRSNGIFLLENLRFFSGEEKNDAKFAKQLASLGGIYPVRNRGRLRSRPISNGIYVNDAFAVSHRVNASVAAITKFLPSYAGLLLEKEIKNLHFAMNPEKPLVVILGGAKISTKICLIKNFESRADYFLIGGGIAHNFLLAQGLPIGDSISEEKTVNFAKKMLKNNRVILPVDYVIKNRKILDIGPNTVKLYSDIINKAETIIWNGPMGHFEDKKFAKGSEEIAKAILNSKAFSVIGGGETATLMSRVNPPHPPTGGGGQRSKVFISTGGGAMLEYLAGKKLPGIEALK